MKKLFAVLLLLSVCLSAQALTYPPWWMLSGSADANGVASFGVPIVVTGTASFSGNANFGGDIVTNKSYLLVHPTTTDGVDSSFVGFTGGGASANTRGGSVVAYGNESAGNLGCVYVQCGNIADPGGKFYIETGSANRFTILSNGNASFSANVYIGGQITASDHAIHSPAVNSLGDAYEIIDSYKSDGAGQVDHAVLSPKVFGIKSHEEPTGRMVTRTAMVPTSPEKRLAETPVGEEPILEEPKTEEVPEVVTVVEPDSTTMSLGKMISAQALVIQDLEKRIKALESK